MDIHSLLLLLTIGPALLFLWWVYYLDKKEKEPKGLIGLLFGVGVLSSIPILIFEVILEIFNFWPQDTLIYSFVEAFMIVAPCEEIVKFLFVFSITWKNKNFTHRYDAIVYAVAVSLGFATIENILYVMSGSSLAEGFLTAILRMCLAIPGHLVFAICMGLFYGNMRHAANKKNFFVAAIFCILSIIVPILMHGFYDFCLFTENLFFVLIFFIFVIFADTLGVLIVLSASKKDIRIVPEEPTPTTFPPDESQYIPEHFEPYSNNDDQFYK